MSMKSILVTGASSGLGRKAAQRLAANDFYVFAAAREIHGVFDGEANVEELKLDITDEQSVKDAFDHVETRQQDHPLWGLVNNAGICIPSPLELLTPTELHRQLDTNVVGQLLVTQAALPQLLASKGRIVNITSGLGSIAVPYLGAYSISQFAKMAFTDALRRELRHSGVSVSVVQPGAIFTPIWDKLVATGQELLRQAPKDRRIIYKRSFEEFLAASVESAQSAPTTSDDFAAAILSVLTTPSPESHYFVGDDAREFAEKSRSSPPSEVDGWFDRQSPTTAEFEVTTA